MFDEDDRVEEHQNEECRYCNGTFADPPEPDCPAWNHTSPLRWSENPRGKVQRDSYRRETTHDGEQK